MTRDVWSVVTCGLWVEDDEGQNKRSILDTSCPSYPPACLSVCHACPERESRGAESNGRSHDSSSDVHLCATQLFCPSPSSAPWRPPRPSVDRLPPACEKVVEKKFFEPLPRPQLAFPQLRLPFGFATPKTKWGVADFHYLKSRAGMPIFPFSTVQIDS